MVDRGNYHDVEKFLCYRRDVQQNSPSTIKRLRSHLRHLLEWADDKLLSQAPSIRPTLPAYLATPSARIDGKPGSLSPLSQIRACETAVQCLSWLRETYPQRFKSLGATWIASLRPSRAVRTQASSPVSQQPHYRVDEVRLLAGLPCETLTEQRDQAAIVLLFLSGARVGALVTLPICCVDLRTQPATLQQWTTLGVHTKLGKSATTYCLSIPGLNEVVIEWDSMVRSQLAPDMLWYAHLSSDGMRLIGDTRAGQERSQAVQKGLRRFCERAGIPYRSPHALRRGHIMYACSLTNDLADYKALSQNIMHENLQTTDKYYNKPSPDDIRERIVKLCQESQTTPDANTHMTEAQLRNLLLEIAARVGNSSQL